MKTKDKLPLQEFIGKRIKELRLKQNLSLSTLAKHAGISKATLSVLEDGKGNPTVSTLWSLACALRIPFGELILYPEKKEKDFIAEGGFNVRLIEHCQGPTKIEAYHVIIEPHGVREAEPHPSGVMEQLFALKGRILVGPTSAPRVIKAGETHIFRADSPHIYGALSTLASALIIITYP